MSKYTQKDYEAIEAAVLESPRGRWFLKEFTKRNRAADTLMLLDAIAKLERGVALNSPHRVSDELAAELRHLSQTIGSMLAGGAGEATEEDAQGAVDQLARVKHQIDGLLAELAPGKPTEAGGALGPKNLQFFKSDEDLFGNVADRAGDPALPLPVVREEQGPLRPRPTQEGDPRDRIVFIHRASSRETTIPLAEEADELPADRSQPGS